MRFFVFLFACSIMGAMAAPNPNFDFSPLTYFPGSWKMVKEFYDSEVNKEYRIENYANLNITVENENELFFKYFNNQTNEIDSLLSFRSSVMGDKVMSFPPFMDVDTNTPAVLHFQPLVANSSYVLFDGVYKQIAFSQDSTGVVEMMIGNKNQFGVKVYDIKEKSLFVFTFTRVVNAPQLTFFQKYGNLIMMGVMMIVQVSCVLCR